MANLFLGILNRILAGSFDVFDVVFDHSSDQNVVVGVGQVTNQRKGDIVSDYFGVAQSESVVDELRSCYEREKGVVAQQLLGVDPSWFCRS